MPRATADANVIISGFHRPGKARSILDLTQSGEIELFVSQPILDEVSDVLQRNKFGWTRAEVKYALDKLMEVAELVDPQQPASVVRVDPSDDRILECAAASSSDYLVTGDKHLLKLGQFGQIKIVKPADFLDKIRGREDVKRF